jgi:hypothetical protein
MANFGTADVFGIVAIILAIVGIILGGLTAVILGIIAIILSLIGMGGFEGNRKNIWCIIGLILGIICLIIGIVGVLVQGVRRATGPPGQNK